MATPLGMQVFVSTATQAVRFLAAADETQPASTIYSAMNST